MLIFPDKKSFLELSKKYNLIAFSYKFYSDWITPVPLYYYLSKIFKKESFLLESIEGEEKICRFSFLGFNPILTFKSKANKVYVEDNNLNVYESDDPLFELEKTFLKFKFAPKEKLRFIGGFVGYLGYDIIRFYEPIGRELRDNLDTFDSYFILPKFLIIFDHIKKEIEVLSFVRINNPNIKEINKKERLEFEKFISKIIKCKFNLKPLLFKKKKLKITSNFKKKDFLYAVKRIKEYIKNGEIIQAVLSQNFSVKFNGDPFDAYRYLRILNPSPYMFYLNFKDLKLAGSSPEMLLRCENKELITRPIAGTRRRGKNEVEDKKLEKSLINDPKERAEHIMLVDLARNDLGRVAKKATVSVPIFMSIERFSFVMHIVSEVRAKLKDNFSVFKALINCFPAGTVSGAPKVRAMQIINEFEPQKRGIYAGCVCYFSFTNNLDSCIIIRTILFKDKKAYIQAGAGIVYDSKPIKEYYETINKARAQILALEYASK